MHEVLVNRLGGLSLPRKSVVRLTDRPDMTLYVYRGRKTKIQQQQSQHNVFLCKKYFFLTRELSLINTCCWGGGGADHEVLIQDCASRSEGVN